MGIIFPTTGQSNWDTPLNDALNDMAVGQFLPNDHGFVAWVYDPAQCSADSTLTSGSVKLIKLPKIPITTLISMLWVHIGVGPTGLTAGQSFLGLYDSTGTRLAQTADLSGDFATTGLKSGALTVPYSAAPGYYYVALMANAATTTPAFSRSATQGASIANANLTTATSRFATSGSGLTSLPANITMSGITAVSTTTWAAAS